ncbi:MAG TPA: hypothetical protein VN922_12735 [Bacteroidia bacterium]|nr:hypothetical protein [Bacteroidia bacterium]
MKTKRLLIGLLMLSSALLKAQDCAVTKGSVLIEGGYSFPNVAQNTFSAIGDGTYNGSTNPAYFKLGYAFSDRNVFGIYMNISSGSTGNINWADSLYGNGTGQPATAYENTYYYYTVNLFTYGIEYAHHFGKSMKFSPYYGALIGYTSVSVTTHGYPPTENIVTTSGSFVAYQLYLGATWYFLPVLGLEGRVSIGNNYYASLGISWKLGGNKASN